MNLLLYTPAACFRSKGKCISISGKLLLLALCCVLLLTEVVCHPPDETFEAFDVGDDYGEVDNVEWHHVRAVNGVMQEDHPIIMYKEDFVSEDFDPSKNQTGEPISSTSRPLRQYKDIAHRRRRLNRTQAHAEHYRTHRPEKIYFDVLPQAPLMVSDDSASNDDTDSKFDPSKIRVDVISLVDSDQNETSSAEEPPSKQLLNKHPKKYHRRQRRDLEAHTVAKRQPYYRYDPPENRLNYPPRVAPAQNRPHMDIQPIYHRFQVQGTLWMSSNDPVPLNRVGDVEIPVDIPDFDVNERFDPDRVVWGSRRPSNVPRVRPTQTPQQQPPAAPAPRPQNRPPLDIFHDSNPDNADFSFLTTPIPARPTRPPLDIFHDSNPDNADLSFLMQQPKQPEQAEEESYRSANNEGSIRFPEPTAPQCDLAARSCCDYKDLIDYYDCFKRLDCKRSILQIMSMCN